MTSTKLILKQVITFPSRSGAYSHNKLLIIVWVGSEQIKPMKTKFSIVEGQFIGRPLPLPSLQWSQLQCYVVSIVLVQRTEDLTFILQE